MYREHERKVWMSIQLMDALCTRDNEGNRLRVEWGEPDAGGVYCPTIHVDYEDNPFKARIEALERKTSSITQTIRTWREKPYTMSAEALLDLIDAALAQTKEKP